MIIKTNQDRELNTDIKIEDVKDYGDFINFLIVKSLLNIIKYTDYTFETILKEDYSFDEIYHSICRNFDLPKIEDYEDTEYLQSQLSRFKIKFIRQTEYNIYCILD